MNDLAKIIGGRIRNQRNKRGLSQEALAERAGLHVTYIGQLERGEKNATLETVGKIVHALNISFETLFEKLNSTWEGEIPLQCYELIDELSRKEQEAMLTLIKMIIEYKELN